MCALSVALNRALRDWTTAAAAAATSNHQDVNNAVLLQLAPIQSALTTASALWNHAHEYRHDLELLHGAATASSCWLVTLVSLVLSKSSAITTPSSSMYHCPDDQSPSGDPTLHHRNGVMFGISTSDDQNKQSTVSYYHYYLAIVHQLVAVLAMVMGQASPRAVAAAVYQLEFTRTPSAVPPTAATSNQQVTSLIPTLLALWDYWQDESSENDRGHHAIEQSLCAIAKILHACSRASELRLMLGRQERLLELLARMDVVSTTTPPTPSSLPPPSFECRLCRIQTLANIANAATEETKRALYHQEGLLETILRLGHFDAEPTIRLCAAQILVELSSGSPPSRSVLGPTTSFDAKAPRSIPVELARNATMLGTLVKMTWLEWSHPEIMEAAVTTLQNLAYWHENRSVLIEFRHGIVLEALKQALVMESSETTADSSRQNTVEKKVKNCAHMHASLCKVRRRAAGALANLVSNETIVSMGRHKGLLATLAMVCSNSGRGSTNVEQRTDENNVLLDDVQQRACVALTKMASYISVHMDSHSDLLDALVVASLGCRRNANSAASPRSPKPASLSHGISAVLRVKARLAENRRVMARHSGILDTLCDFCVLEDPSAATSSDMDRDNAIRALMHLVNDDTNRSVLCQNEKVLNAIVHVAASARYEPESNHQRRQSPDHRSSSCESEAHVSAIRALERLATLSSNRPIMAQYPGLLVAVAKAVEWEATLQEQMNDEMGSYLYLAKPLLLTLLLAM
jgi:hypothetical protein